MKEIRSVMRKHDVIGMVFLGSKEGYSEFAVPIECSWSVLKYEPADQGKMAIRFRAKGKAEGQLDRMVQATTNFIFNLASFLDHQRDAWHGLCAVIRQQAEITHNENFGKVSNEDREMEDEL